MSITANVKAMCNYSILDLFHTVNVYSWLFPVKLGILGALTLNDLKIKLLIDL